MTDATPGRPQLSMTLYTFSKDDPGNWDYLVSQAVLADECGVDRLALSDHIAFGENMDAYADPAKGGTAGGKQPTGPDGHWLEPLSTISFLAALTSQVRFGTNILLAALRRPAALANQLSTIDVLSKGRIDLGVGVGWQREEYEAVGLSFEGRGRLLDHTLEVCQTLWSENSASYSSDELSFSNIHQQPKPIQPGGVPVWVSGTTNDRAMKRLATFGTGWIPWGPDAADITSGIERMRAQVSKHGGDPSKMSVQGSLKVERADDAIDLEATMAPVAELADAGVTDFRIGMPIPDPKTGKAQLTETVEAFRQATAHQTKSRRV